MRIPLDIVPKCLKDGSEMTLNLRVDDIFVEDEGWYNAPIRYQNFINRFKNGIVVYLVFGVGMNTPAIIKYPFYNMVYDNNNATYACINFNEVVCPNNIVERSIIINEDIDKILNDLLLN